ncbi:A/G-specific adenine glycosylase [Methylacidimicrobium sp. B4]|uniref:A/G-specific adenine glycosylase n=1 Tax=Methylacidimicrobium sp. B4 TaxID=2796139 RepID=UPI001A8F3A94|nr:A/G-specific adenine glycosylase [Methylacidimicrobium sp. B4]QSR85521.1 A/G-specific adenine glycosylase [Methylacidimicrobium sp. B4]
MRIERKFRQELRRRLLSWYREEAADLPWRRRPDPYAVLVSEVMLQQTRVATVVAYYERWMAHFPDFFALAQASEEEVLRLWEGLGYYARARNLHRIARLLAAEHQGRLPSRTEDLERLPGIGRYTAGAVASLAFGQRTPLVDGNVRRLFHRLFALPEETGTNQLWEIAEALLPTARDCAAFNSALMEMGRTVCMPRKACCQRCPVGELCRSRGGVIASRRKSAPARCEECAALIVRDGLTWLVPSRQVRYRGLWRLPELDSDRMRNLGEAARLSYAITRYRVCLTLFRADWQEREHGEGKWVAPEELARLPLPAPHRRALAIACAGTPPPFQREEQASPGTGCSSGGHELPSHK